MSHNKGLLPVGLFSSFSEVARAGSNMPNCLDLTILDESHRLWDFRKRKYNGFTQILSDVPMLEEILSASRVCVFFVDDRQAIRSDEIGTLDTIWNTASTKKSSTEVIKLTTQFRCSGSISYIQWVNHVLDYNEGKSLNWKLLNEYDFRIMDSMQEMQDKLDAHFANGNTCRFVAGFCWPWSPTKDEAHLKHDLKDDRFGRWSAPWNERTAIDAPVLSHRYFKWSTDDSYYPQVGTIYSIQGFEFDYIGLIFGDDFIWSSEGWKYDLNKNQDQSFKEGLIDQSHLALERLRNIYRVLLTRGLKGTYVFFVNENTKRRFIDALS